MFYVTDLTGTKVVNPNRQAAIRRHLMEVLQGRDSHEPQARQARAAGALSLTRT